MGTKIFVRAKMGVISQINISDESILISANKVDLSGLVTVSSLTSGGTTVIDGSRITTGVIKSSGYSYTSGNTYSTAGTSFDLSNGAIRSKNFAIDASGNAYFKGNIDATSGTIGGFTISNNALYSVKMSINDGITGVYLGTNGIALGDNFSVDAEGHLTAKSAEFTGTIHSGSIIYANEIKSGELKLSPNYNSDIADMDCSFKLFGMHKNVTKQRFAITYNAQDTQYEDITKIRTSGILDIASEGTGIANYVMFSGDTYFENKVIFGSSLNNKITVDFSGAEVTGLTVNAVFA